MSDSCIVNAGDNVEKKCEREQIRSILSKSAMFSWIILAQKQ